MAKAPTKIVDQPTPLPQADFERAAPPLAQAEPLTPQTSEIVQARTRYGFPVYVPTQKKLLAPAETYPLILDSWVRNQLEQERGALVRVTL